MATNKTKVVYLTWGETPRAYGIYRTQVAGTLAKISQQHQDVDLHLIAGLPIIHSGLVRERHRYPAELRRLREALGNVPLRICPIPVTQNFVYPTRKSFNAIFIAANLTLLPKLKRLAPDVVHCRSFLATWIANELRQKNDLNYRIVYDARSLWPEMQYRRRPDIQDLQFFKAKENKLVSQVDAVVGVNDPMTRHYTDMGAKQAITNYIAAPLVLANRSTTRQPGDPIRLVYAGALHEGGMQTPAMLFELAAKVRDLLGPITLKVLTTSAHDPLQKIADTYLEKGVVDFEAVFDPARMSEALRQNDFACNVYKRPISDIDLALCQTGLSTKSAEYLAAGLPILVSKYPQAVGHLVEKNNVGAVFDETAENFGLTTKSLQNLLSTEVNERARELASGLFDLDVVAARFAHLYQDLSSRPD